MKSSKESERLVKRILVALDTSAHSMAALRAAAELAARLEAELEGIFVEDENLIRLASLSFVRQQEPFSAARRRLELRQIEREMAVCARRLEQAFHSIAEESDVQGTFRVVRGTVEEELLAAAIEADILFLGRAGHSPGRRHHMGSTARHAALRASCATFVVRQGSALARPILVVYDGSPSAQRALAVAAAFRIDMTEPLTILLWAVDAQAEMQLRGEAAAWLRENGVAGQFAEPLAADAAGLVQILRAQPCGTLVLPAGSGLLEEPELLHLAGEAVAPVLLVR